MVKISKILLVGSLFFGGVLTQAQDINYGNPTVPFGSNTGYEFGSLPTNLPSGGEYGASQDAADYYVEWYNEYVAECTDGRRYIHWDSESDWVSEGVAYGMIIAAYMGDKPLLDDLWFFYKDNANSNGLMGWQGTCGGVQQSGAASDAEVDAAMALIVANYQWPNQNYDDEARGLITGIYDYEIQPSSKLGPYQLLAGDSWGSTGDNVRNPGYIPMGYFKEYAAILEGVDDVQSAVWTNDIIPANYTLLLANTNTTTGLCSDGCKPDGTGGSNWGADFGDDASRYPWRTAVDAYWYGEETSIEVCSDIASYCASKGGPSSAPGKISRDGVGTGTVNLIYQSMFGAGVIAADPQRSLTNGYTVQSLIDDYYSTIVNTTQPYYFHSILKMMSLMVMTGNFWRPGHEEGQCIKPALGNDVSLCGVGSIGLNAGSISTTNRTFTWYKDGAKINNESGKTITVNEAGVYKVEADSMGCVSKDEVIVSDVLPVVDLGDDITLCTPSSIEVNANVAGNGIVYNWEKDGVSVGNTDQLWIREAGIYSLEISASGCASQTDELVVESMLPQVQDAEICNGTASLQVLDNSGDYRWFASEEAVDELGSGAELMVDQAGTYWVEDKSSFEANIGPNSIEGTSTNWGEKSYTDNFYVEFTTDASFSIQSLSISYGVIYSDQTSVIEVEIRNAAGELKDSFVSESRDLTTTDAGLIEFQFTDFVVDAAWGNELIMSLNTAGTTVDGRLDWASGSNYDFSTFSDPSGTIQITGVNAGGQSGSNYVYFYDWNVLVGSACARMPVVASEGTNCVISEVSEAIEAISISPNPVVDVLTIAGEYTFGSILNSSGISVMSLNETKTIDVASLANGIYMIQLITANGVVSTSFVKE